MCSRFLGTCILYCNLSDIISPNLHFFLQIFLVLKTVWPSSETRGHGGYPHNYSCVFWYMLIMGQAFQIWLWLFVSCILISQSPCASDIYIRIFFVCVLGLDIFMPVSIFSIKNVTRRINVARHTGTLYSTTRNESTFHQE